MNLEKLRKHCLSYAAATEQIQWGSDLVFKVGGKMFAVAATEPGAGNRLSFKCSDEGFAELLEREGIVPAPYMARAKWVALETFDALTDRELLARGTRDETGLRWVQAEHRVRPELLVAQTGYMQGAAGIGMWLLRLDAAENGRKNFVRFPDTPF